MNEYAQINSMFASALGTTFSYVMPIIIWSIVLIIIGFKRPPLDRRRMRIGVFLLITSLLLPIIAFGVFELIPGASGSRAYGGGGDGGMVFAMRMVAICGLVAKLCAVLSISFAIYAIVHLGAEEPAQPRG